MFTQRGKLALIDTTSVEWILIAGDIHGEISSFRQIMKSIGPRDLAILLGDYADRGSSGLEVVEELIKAKRSFMGRILPLKGNHETFTPGGEPRFFPSTLAAEAERKGRKWREVFGSLGPFFDSLPIAAVIPGFALLVHGGISKGITPAAIEEPTPECEDDVLWSDPGSRPGQHSSPRGKGCLFGADVTSAVLKSFGVTYLIRSHQPQKAADGLCFEHGGKVITTSATGIYGGRPFIMVMNTRKLPKSRTELTACVEYLD